MGERGERDDDDGERGRHVFIIVVDVDVDAVNSNPSCQACTTVGKGSDCAHAVASRSGVALAWRREREGEMLVGV
jgi:hypothetical protein